MFYLVYKTTNVVNGKIYIGCHKTENINDGYLGSGKLLKRAMGKYGVKNFTREILAIFDNPADMFTMEAVLVNEQFVNDNTNYNLKIGGEGGWDYINNNKLGVPHITPENASGLSKQANEKKRQRLETDPEYRARVFANIRAGAKLRTEKYQPPFLGKVHTDSTKKRMSKAHAGKHTGEKNSQYGTCWIHSLEEKINKKISKTELAHFQTLGWIKGRKMKF